VFRWYKTFLSLLLLSLDKRLKPHPVFVKDPRLQALSKIFNEAIEKERDPIMKARWNALRKSVLWLCSHDGAYRVRLIWLLQQIAKNKKEWKFRPTEAPF
jgi:hypothetical protein